MSRAPLGTLAAAALLLVATAVSAGDSNAALKEISGYRDWARVNEKPIEVNNELFLGG
jgi:hypothetical protein